MIAKWTDMFSATLRPGESVVYAGMFEDAVKIGISINPKERLRNLTTMSGRSFTKAFVLSCESPYDARKAEMRLHELYKRYRIEGEWFQLNAAAVVQTDFEVELSQLSIASSGEGLTEAQASLGYHFVAVATPKQVHDAQINAVKAAFVPIMAEIMVSIAATAQRAGKPFVITPGMKGSEAMLAWGDLIEEAGGLHHFQSLGDVLDEIAKNASYGSEEDFIASSSRENGGIQ